jgi:hypothetical protein
MRRRPLRARPRRPEERRWGSLALALVLGVLLGALGQRWATMTSVAEPPTSVAVTGASTSTTSPAATTTATPAIALCPCPPPPRPRAPAAQVRRAPLPSPKGPAPTPPLTDEVARYLRDSARLFARCAPSTGAPLTLHLELTVRPTGTVDNFRIANVDPTPPDTSACVEQVARGLTPPATSHAAAEVYALTLVL